MNNIFPNDNAAERRPRKLNAEGRGPLEQRARLLRVITRDTLAAIEEMDRGQNLHILRDMHAEHDPMVAAVTQLARPALQAVPTPAEVTAPTFAAMRSEAPAFSGNIASLDTARSRIEEARSRVEQSVPGTESYVSGHRPVAEYPSADMGANVFFAPDDGPSYIEELYQDAA